jgi:phage protein D
MGSSLSYAAMDRKYAGFEFPQARVELNGKAFGDTQKTLIISDVSVDLTSGFEASVARFRIYNAYDQGAGEYLFDAVKSQAVLGALLKIYLGYMKELTHVFTGYVASVGFCYNGTDPPYIDVTGMDAKGAMMASSYAAQLTARSYGDAVKEILERAAYKKMKSAKILDANAIQVTPTPDKTAGGNKASAETIEIVSESDYEFIMKAAKKFNYEFFIDRGAALFRKAKSNATPLTALRVGEGLLTYDMNYSLTGMVETIEVRSMDAGAGKIVSSAEKYQKKLSTGNKAEPLLKSSKHVYIDPTVFTQEQADARKASLMEQMSYRLGSVECECIGLPDIVPGRFVDINVGAPGDNSFYITNVVHDLPSSGEFRTRLTGKADSLKTSIEPSV